MDVGVALPQMVRDVDRATVAAWCGGIDEGPFSSVSAGERITFFNGEMMTLLAAAAVLTERVTVMANVCVTPWHPTALVAKQFSTIDVLSAGRLAVALGVGGRQQDYDALGASFGRRHQQVDEAAGELRRIWAGGVVADAPVGPAPVQPGGPPLYGSPLGPKSVRRCAQWADGVSAFSLAADPAEAARIFQLADDEWERAGRSSRPRRICGFFYVLGGDDPSCTLRGFAETYLAVFGQSVAHSLAAQLQVSSPTVLREVLDGFEAIGCDEVVLVPGDRDPRCLSMAAEVVAARR